MTFPFRTPDGETLTEESFPLIAAVREALPEARITFASWHFNTVLAMAIRLGGLKTALVLYASPSAPDGWDGPVSPVDLRGDAPLVVPALLNLLRDTPAIRASLRGDTVDIGMEAT